MTTIGINDYATVGGAIAATSALEGQMAATQAITKAIGDMIPPPGSEGASFVSAASQLASNSDFSMKLIAGVAELSGRNGLMGLHSAKVAATDAAGAAALAGIPITV